MDGASDGPAPDEGAGKPDGFDLGELEIGAPQGGFRVNVLDASIEGDQLTVDMQHAGGCGDHEYHLSWDGTFLESLPLQAQLSLRDVSDDFCEALLVRSATFDISALREAHGGESGQVLLRVDDFSGEAPLYEWAPGTEPSGNALQIGTPPGPSDAVEIEDARVEGSELVIDVAYGGGCEEHEFALFWDGSVFETFPLQVDLELYHDANNDFCESFRFETLRFDISALALGEPVNINLSGFGPRIPFE